MRLRRDLRRERAQRTGDEERQSDEALQRDEERQRAVTSASAAEVSDGSPLPADAVTLPVESASSDGETVLPAPSGEAEEQAVSAQPDQAAQPGDVAARKAASTKARKGRRRASHAVPPVPRPGSRSSAPARPATDAARPRSGAGRTTTVGAAFAIVALVCGTTLPVSAALVHADDKGTTTAAAADIRAQSYTADDEILPEVRISGSYTATTPEELRDIRAAEAAMAKTGVASIAKPGQVIQPLTAGSYTLTDGFGAARSGRSHMGQDYAAAIGTPIYAVADGVVSLSQESYQGYGVTVQLEHPGLGGGQAVSTLYSHMQYGSRAVEVGQRVTAGQFLGYVGNTGWIVGSCLHLEVHINGTAIDPLPWMEANVR